MRTYKVTWEIEVDAESPEEAAIMAQNFQQHPTTADHFTVADELAPYEGISADPNTWEIDISEINHE